MSENELEPTTPPASRPRVPTWLIAGLVSLLAGALVTAGVYESGVLPGAEPPAESQPLAHADLPVLLRDLQCLCCGENLADCTCQMAVDRRQMLHERVTLGDSKRDVYEFMLLHDGQQVFFDAANAEQAQAWLEEKVPAERPEIALHPARIEMGTISMADGLAEARYLLRNDGSMPLVISDMTTSCMCTTVAIETEDGLGPAFGMHPEDKPQGWTQTLEPGEEAMLVVTFDPNAHGPEAVGNFLREVTITSNDPLQPKAKVQLAVTVEP